MDSNRSLWDAYSIPVALFFLLIMTGGFVENNGLSGDFGLDYCNDKDSLTQMEETELEVAHFKSFFACELGYVDGVVAIGRSISSFGVGGVPRMDIETTGQVMILNHENYIKFVNGETYGFSNFYLSELQSSAGAGETSEYKVGITLHSDTYFFVVDRGYGTNIGGEKTGRDLLGPNSPTGSTADPIYFYYVVDLDYDTSGVVTTN